jgi:leucyl aminopeptidase (aminopeptidase T)
MTAEQLEELAELIVGFGANVQPGQIVAISTEPGKEEVTRALAAAAYRAGAKFVDPWYFDYAVKRERLLHGREDDLAFVPDWYGHRLLELSRLRCARIALTGASDPALFDGIPAALAGKDQLPWLEEGGRDVNDRTTNWCGVPCPTRGWAKLVHPDLPEDEAYERLWEQMLHILRMDTPDPTRADGVVTATKPLVLGGSTITGLRVEFEGGRATKIDADENAEVLRAYASRDEGASRLGEVALVDGEGRIGPLDTVFFDTLLDENAASHIALGSAYTFAVEGDEVERANQSAIHVDFMIGSEAMEVDGLTIDGETVPVLRSGAWQI